MEAEPAAPVGERRPDGPRTVEPPGPRPRTGGLRRGKHLAALVVCLALVVLLVLTSLGVGARGIPLGTVARVLLHDDGSPEAIIVRQLRMPRTVLAVVVGAALALAGVVMQAITRNPLAEPGIVGVNAGASFAVVVAIAAFHVTGVSGYIWFAFAGAVLAALIVHTLTSGATRGHHHTRLVLAGAALSASLGACTGIITMFNTTAFDSYRFWVVGALENRGTEALTAAVPFILVGTLIALALGPSLNALALGDETGAALGLRVPRVRAAGFLSIMLLCGASTAAAGPIAFVGLVVPHVLRLVLGPDLRPLLAFALPGGAILLLVSDIAGRVMAPPGEIEVGIVTAFIGAPALLWLVVRRKEVAA
ncbi:iron ABC transporter permease [Streptomyces scopuliridis]|uniref:Iron ABC transporter permease n=1 Tax=Streptomyces scopuliridis TaxID=452529 RepID=A0ACD4ZDH2_9ACTN|nr:iron ABC transporter permease [Streptomyces scopuliridis]WSB32095.1 iron ABC transporter permease [Streptomyces scopuliridis]WSB96357.1 iron ABC transporter permease [Streptomyces scopuliridis]WSC09938.1 iron ABC transporter permease [Streptomyces scopuliridis]